MTLPFISALIATYFFSRILINRSGIWGMDDHPGERKVHSTPTPRTGGLAMWIGAGIASVILCLAGRMMIPSIPWQTWTAGLGFVTIGALDDRYSFRPRNKFGVFLILAILAAWPWCLLTATHDFRVHWGTLGFHLPTFVSFPLLALWFMAVPNAVNIEDAINGYMGGFTFFVLGACALMGVNTSLFLGVTAGFLLLNWPRAKHFMGDAGSFGCGFLIAETLLRAGGLARPALALILTAPISLDILMGMVRRKRLRQSLFDADQATCPHHVMSALGGSATWASLILWLNAAALFWTMRRPVLLALHLVCYVGVLIFLNRRFLFQPRPVGATLHPTE